MLFRYKRSLVTEELSVDITLIIKALIWFLKFLA